MQKTGSLSYKLYLVFAVVTRINAGRWVFKQARLEAFTMFELNPGPNEFPEPQNQPIQKSKIQGKFAASYQDSQGRIQFQVSYRNTEDSEGYKNGQILEFSIPFKPTKWYKDQHLVYAFDHRDPRYTLQGQHAKQFNFEQTFYIGKGEEVKAAPLELKYLETKITLENGDEVTGKSNEVVVVNQFRVLFQKNHNRLYDLEISMSSTTEDNYKSGASIGFIFVFGAAIMLCSDLSAAQQMAKGKRICQLVATFTTGVLFPYFCLISLKYASTFWALIAGLVIIVTLGLVHTIGAVQVILTYIIDKNTQSDREMGVVAVTAVCNLIWFFVLIFWFGLILKLFYFYALILLIDVAVSFFGEPAQRKTGTLFFFTLLGCIKCLIDQVFVYLVYRGLFKESHGESPEIFWSYLFKDLLIIMLVIMLSGLGELILSFWKPKTFKKSKSPEKGVKEVSDDQSNESSAIEMEGGEVPRKAERGLEDAKAIDNGIPIAGNDINIQEFDQF